MQGGAYQPYVPARRPGGKPPKKPRYRMLVHRQYSDLWERLPERVGLENVQQVYDHVSNTPGAFPPVGRSSILAGKAGRPRDPGFSPTIHFEITGTGRIDYQICNDYRSGAKGDPHPVVRILTIYLSSH